MSWRARRGEFGPNLAAFDARGLRVAELPTDGEQRIDVAAFARSLRRPGPRPDLVHVTQVSSHSGLLQPAAQMAQVCREQGVVCVVDAAQSLGHVDAVTVAAAAYGTSRKWLAGPRGVGLLAVRPALAGRLRPALGPDRWPEDLPAARWVESREGHIAGRVGSAWRWPSTRHSVPSGCGPGSPPSEAARAPCWPAPAVGASSSPGTSRRR